MPGGLPADGAGCGSQVAGRSPPQPAALLAAVFFAAEDGFKDAQEEISDGFGLGHGG
jgi:hypothetical protein